MRILIAVLLCSVAHADSSVGKTGASLETGWCLARFLKQPGQKPPPNGPPLTLKPVALKVGGLNVRFEMPEKLVVRTLSPELIQVGESGSDDFTGWPSIFQVRVQTRAELEARIKAIVSDFMGSTRVEIEVRPTKIGEELCAVVRRTPGHITLTDGRHFASPDAVELVHAVIQTVGDKTIGAAYRLSSRDIDQVQGWEKMIESLRLTR